MKGEIKLAELAQRSGVAPRTIRFYIARGLLPGPGSAGRHALYGAAHLERLARIEELKREGRTLTEIGHVLEPGGAGGMRLPEPEPRLVFTLTPEVEVTVRTGLPPWRLHRLRRALAALAQQLQEPDEEEGR